MAENVKQFKTYDDEIHNIEDTTAREGLQNVYTKSETDTLLSGKVDSSDVYDKATLNSMFDSKADEANVYTKTETNNLLDLKADANAVYTKTEADTLLDGKANVGVSYTKSEEDNLLLGKANANNVYTKTEADTLLSAKADASNVYTKAEADTLLGTKANANEVYTITQTNALLGDKADVSTVTGLASTVAQLDGKVDLNYQNTAKLDSANTFEVYQKINSSGIDTTDTPSTTTWGDGVSFGDKNSVRTGFIAPLQNTDGSVDLNIDIDTNNNPNGKVLINQIPMTPTLLHDGVGTATTLGQAVPIINSVLTNYQNILGRIIVQLNDCALRWQGGANWTMDRLKQGSPLEFEWVMIDLSNANMRHLYTNAGNMIGRDCSSDALLSLKIFVI